MAEMNNNGWNEWANFVLKTLEELKKDTGENNELINKLRIELKVLQTKMDIRAGLIGAISGFLPAVTVLIYFLIKTKTG